MSDKGWRQASGLVQLLEGEAVARVLSSPYLRCLQTVEPLGAARGLTPQPEAALEEGSDWQVAFGLIRASQVPTVMCSQGDVIGSVVHDLVGKGLADPDARSQKGATWVLDVEDGRVAAARYLPPRRA